MKADLETQLTKAYDLLNEGQADEAEQLAVELKKTASSDPRWYFLLAEIAQSRGEGEKAISIIDEALSLYPDNFVLLFEKANLLFDELGEVGAAAQILKKLVSQFHSDTPSKELQADTYMLLSDAYEVEGKYEKALAMAEKAVEVLPADQRVHWGLANALFDVGRAEEAFEKVQKAISQDDMPDNYWLLGRIQLFQGKEEEAKNAFLKAAALDSKRFYLPPCLSSEEFLQLVNKALKELPPAIADFIENAEIALEEVPPEKLIKEQKGILSPSAFAFLEAGEFFVKGKDDPWDHPPERLLLFKRNLEVASHDQEEIKDNLKSTLIHQVTNYLE